MENTKEELLVERRRISLDKVKLNFKKYKMIYCFFLIMLFFTFTDFILIKKFVSLLLTL